MDKLADIARRRRAAHARLVALDSEVYRAFLAMERATYRDGALSRREKELIAVGISVAEGCESCMQWHVEQAARAGASHRQVLEAIEVAIEMGGGPATVSARLALEVLDGAFAPGSRVRRASPGAARASAAPGRRRAAAAAPRMGRAPLGMRTR